MQREGAYTTRPLGRFSDSSNHTGKLASSEPRAQTDMEREDLIQSNQHLQPSYLGLGMVLGMGVPQHSPALQELLVQWEGKTGTPPGATEVGQASCGCKGPGKGRRGGCTGEAREGSAGGGPWAGCEGG